MTDQAGRIRSLLRSGGALIMLAYVIGHFADHILLLVSIPVAMEGHRILIEPWRTAAGTTLLASGALGHYGNALWSIYVRRTLRLSRWGWWQLGLGLSIPPLLCWHLVDTRLGEMVTGVAGTYVSVLLRLWVLWPWHGIIQVAILAVVWAHACIGIHFWWRTKRWYERWRLPLTIFALLWPTLALAGYVAGGEQVLRAAQQTGFVDAELARAHLDAVAMASEDRIALWILTGHIALVAFVVIARALRRAISLRARPAKLNHVNGRTIPIHPGATILETLDEHGIPHASVCGGRGRCTTCRIKVLDGAAALPAPGAIESRALARIGAPPDCRLACQTRPTADVTIVPLLSAPSSAREGHSRAGFSGHEQLVTVMFVDLRGSTTLGERRMPFDVLFLLDRFLGEMAAALEVTGGHFSQFTGDGLMALYGLDRNTSNAGAADALRCAADMIKRLEQLNRRLIGDLTEPLRIGIGIHQGEAIVGSLGPPGSQILTAIGDTVNTTARLEGLSKKHGGAVIVSRRAAEAAGLDLSTDTLEVATLAGRAEPVEYYALALPSELAVSR